MTDDRLEWHLANWAGWMRGRAVHLTYPSRAAGGFQSAHSDFDSMADWADNRCAQAVEAILSDLTTAEVCAVHWKHLGAVWRFPRADVLQLYDSATDAIRKGLVHRGIF